MVYGIFDSFAAIFFGGAFFVGKLTSLNVHQMCQLAYPDPIVLNVQYSFLLVNFLVSPYIQQDF